MPDLGRPPSEVFLCLNEEKRRFMTYSRVYSAEKLRETLFFDKKGRSACVRHLYGQGVGELSPMLYYAREQAC